MEKNEFSLNNFSLEATTIGTLGERSLTALVGKLGTYSPYIAR